MLKWMGFAARLFAVVIMLGFYTAAMATKNVNNVSDVNGVKDVNDVNDPNKCDPNKPRHK